MRTIQFSNLTKNNTKRKEREYPRAGCRRQGGGQGVGLRRRRKGERRKGQPQKGGRGVREGCEEEEADEETVGEGARGAGGGHEEDDQRRCSQLRRRIPDEGVRSSRKWPQWRRSRSKGGVRGGGDRSGGGGGPTKVAVVEEEEENLRAYLRGGGEGLCRVGG